VQNRTPFASSNFSEYSKIPDWQHVFYCYWGSPQNIQIGGLLSPPKSHGTSLSCRCSLTINTTDALCSSR